MRIIDITHPPQSLWIGREGENTFRPVSFECANWFITYPNATIAAYYQPYGSSDPYPLVLTVDGTKRIWHPLLAELVKGDGELQIVLMNGETVGTSAIIPTKVDRSLISNAEHPASETPAWPVKVVQDVTEQANRAEAAVEHYPQIVNGVWFVWDAEQSEFVSTGISAQGEDGISPTVTVTAIEGGHRVTITDATGAHQFDVMDGEDGTGGSSDAVLYTEQDLTDAQKQQARANIGAGTYSKPNGGIPDSDIAPGVIPDVSDKQNAPLEIPITTNDGGESYTTTVTAAQIRAAKENAVFVFDMFRLDATAWLPHFFDTNIDILAGVLDSDIRIEILVSLANDSVSVAVQMSQRQSIPTKVSELTNDSNFQTAAQVQSAIAAIPKELPAVTASDNGKFLRVVNGAWAAATVPAAESNSFGGGS